MRKIVIIGTLDTKGEETAYLKARIEEGGCRAVVVDSGILGEPMFQPEVSRQEVAGAAGTTIEGLIKLESESRIVEVMGQALARIVKGLYGKGELDGIISLGGSMGSSLGTAAMRGLPFGIPKVMISTSASTGDTVHWVGTKDIIMFHSVCDVLGLNSMTIRVIDNAANAILGMVKADIAPKPSGGPVIAVSNMGTTTRATTQARILLEEKGYEVIVFHSVGIGGQALEEAVNDGMVDAVLDLSMNEVIANLFGAYHDAGPLRLEESGDGVPRVIAPGNIDFLTYLPENVPPRFKDRKFTSHVPPRIILRTSKEDNAEVGRVIAGKLNRAKGKRAVIIPKKGFSEYGRSGNIFYDLEADAGFGEGLRQELKPGIAIVEVDAHINDPLFAREAVKLMTRLLAS
jgi:uncharacterized protein (UPF0261 family)